MKQNEGKTSELSICNLRKRKKHIWPAYQIVIVKQSYGISNLIDVYMLWYEIFFDLKLFHTSMKFFKLVGNFQTNLIFVTLFF